MKAEAPAKKPERKPAQQQLSQRQERRRQEGGRRRQPQRRAPLPQAKRELIVSVDVGEQRVAVLEDDRVAEVYLERPERRSIAGNIYLGTVDNVLPGMEAAFVEIGLEKNGFLYVDEIVGPELERGHGRRIQDLISRGQTILVQAVKDPMKTKGARLTTQISLPGRFVVFVPQGEGLGVSRRLEDDERNRLKDILKKLNVKEGGVIVRTAAEGASEEDIERDLVFLQRLWKSIQAKAKAANAPELIYQEAELPLRVTRDLFTGDFERALVDNDQAYKRITGYLKKTSPHMVDRVIRYREKTPLMEAFGVDAEIRSTLNRRVDLPSGGYLIFDYAEAFTVIDVNTGRFVGSRGKQAGGRLEDTITKNNLEAVKEVVRQLRLRDIGGIIVIDFIDMASPKNRATVEKALGEELERDRTKTYVVEISPLGLVEMTRQNVTEGPREVMTRKCPTCGGDGIVLSEASAAIDMERRLRTLVAGSRSQAYRVELAASIASTLIGPGAKRLVELEALTKRRFFLEGKPDMHLDHFVVLAEGKLADLTPASPVAEGAELQIELVEVDRHDATAAVGKIDGL
ncbi:MAG: Rne/Rng family ribonuclease, partial [Gaiellaceae bacterium]